MLLSRFSHVRLCDPIDGSPPGSPVPGILQARTLEWVAISFSNAWKWKVKGKSLSHVQLLVTPWTAPYQALPSMGFSRQEYWSGMPLPSPMYKMMNMLINLVAVISQCICISKFVYFKYINVLINYSSIELEKNIEDPKELLFMWIVSISVYHGKYWDRYIFNINVLIHLKITVKILHVNINNTFYEK